MITVAIDVMISKELKTSPFQIINVCIAFEVP